ncbi:hypothetical protein LXL04_006391 [Taraxacum kok-saghyz]
MDINVMFDVFTSQQLFNKFPSSYALEGDNRQEMPGKEMGISVIYIYTPRMASIESEKCRKSNLHGVKTASRCLKKRKETEQITITVIPPECLIVISKMQPRVDKEWKTKVRSKDSMCRFKAKRIIKSKMKTKLPPQELMGSIQVFQAKRLAMTKLPLQEIKCSKDK